MKKTFKSILSVMLVISMIMGMCGICTVSAAEDTQIQAEDRGTPNATVSILKPLTLTAAEHDYMVWPSGDDTVDRPLQMVMNFKANETMEEAAAGPFADFKCDFYLTFTGLENGSIVADDCYLAGNYGSFGWIVIPADGLELEDGVEYPVMAAYDANLKYAQDICGSVKDFTAAIYVAPAILEANPDFAVSLALKMTNPEDETDIITVGEPAVFNATALSLSADVPAVEDDGLANEANADVIEDARAELLALGVDADDVADATATIDITIASTPDENGVIVYNVAPTLAAGGKSVKMSSFAEALTFRLPVLATETKTAANVYHDGTLMGIYDIIEADGQKFVEVSSDSFSEYTVEPVEAEAEAYVAQIGTETFATVLDAIAYAVENGSTEIKLLADSREVMPTDVEIVLKNNLTITADAPVTAAFYNNGTSYDFIIDCEGYGDYAFTVAENVTFTLEDRVIWVGYYASNIDVVVGGTLSASQVWVGGDVYVNETGTLNSTGEALVIRRGKTLFVDGGKVDANYFNILSGHIFAENGAEIECGALWINNTGSYANEGNATVTLYDSTLTSSGNITATTSIESGVYIDVYNSTATFTNFDGYGASSFDANTTVYVNGETGTLDVKDLVNNGTIEVYDNGTLNVPANASVTNNGAIVLEAGSTIAGPENMGVTVDADGAEVEYVDGKYVVVVETSAAKLTDANGNVTSYDSFTAAYNDAVNGDTITLYADAYLTGKFYIAKEITIDGNGYSIIADANAVWYTVSGKLNIKNYKTHLIGVNANNITLKNITLDCNNNAAGINIYCAQNVVFDNVAIINATKGFAALTVNGSTLTVKNAFTTAGNAVAMDISNGDGVTSDLGVTVEEGTVFDLADKTVKFASVAELDMTAAVNADGEPYFASKDNAYFYTENQMNSRTTAYGNGLTLLSDVEMTRALKLSSGTLDLNGNNLTVADGYTVEVSGNVTIAGEGTFDADVTLTKESATLTAPENVNVTSPAGNVVYKNGVYVVFETIEFDGTTMTLGSSLSLDFAIDTAKLDGTDNYAVLTHAYADGRSETVTVPQSEWTVYSGTVYTIHFNGLAAKQMNDAVTVTVYNAADEAVSVTLTDSIIAYATRMLDSDEVKANAELMAVYVDMLNYGAAAQEQFDYDTENLANRNLTDEQKAYATAAVETTDNRVKGTGYVGSTLTLESVIELDFVFADNKVGSDYSTLYAIVTYTDHYGNAKEIRLEGTDFIEYGSIMCQVSVTGMAIADFRSVVECTVYNADGAALASASDSIESYANRNAASLGAIVDTIVKFGESSYNYFH